MRTTTGRVSFDTRRARRCNLHVKRGPYGPKLWMAPSFIGGLESCKGKRFAIANFGVYGTADLIYGHSNALVFDLLHRRVERFCPAGRHSSAHDRTDETIERLILARLPPGWSYVGTRDAPQKGIQERADAYRGMCIAYSLWYTLLRCLNPYRTAAQIQRYMVRGTPREIQSKVLRLAQFMNETLDIRP